MNLDEEQQRTVAKWVGEGLSVSELQSRMRSELGFTLTYMEVRFLLDDLKLNPKNRDMPAPAPPAGADAASRGDDILGGPEKQRPGAGRVSVTVDQLARPGAVVSGKVTFSDGESAEWQLDQMGRLGLAARKEGYRPSQNDLVAFQTELQNELARAGF